MSDVSANIDAQVDRLRSALEQAYHAGYRDGLARSPPQQIRSSDGIKTIQQCVAKSFGTPIKEMKSIRRSREFARPRQVAMYLARELTDHSLPVIARHFGNRDHTTVMYAIKHVEALARSDADFGERVSALRQHLSGAVDEGPAR